MTAHSAQGALRQGDATMVGRRALAPVTARGWRSGLANLLRQEQRAWWGGWRWLWQPAIWLVLLDGMLALMLWTDPEAAKAEGGIVGQGIRGFMVFAAMAGAIGVIVMAQNAIIGEKQSGTAAWILSKPVARPAFLLAKMIALGTGILATMLPLPGLVAYVELWVAGGAPLPVVPFLGSLGLLGLVLLCYLSVTLLLGTLVRSRTPVIAVPLVCLFAEQLTGAPVLPLAVAPVAGALARGQALPSLLPVATTLLLTVLFLAVAIWRFEREEF